MPPHPQLQEWLISVPAGATADAVAKNEVATRGTQTGHEYVSVYERSHLTQVHVATASMPDSCHLTASKVELALGRGNCVLFHNHPSNRPFSVSDYVGLIDPYPSVTAHALGHDGISNFAFTASPGAQDIGTVADRAWTLTDQYALAMGWLNHAGTFSNDDDWAVRHGIAMGLHAINKGAYIFSHFPQQAMQQSLRLCNVASSYVVEHFRMTTFCRSSGLAIDHAAISGALAWLTKVNAPLGLFQVNHPSLYPSHPISQHLISQPAFSGFNP